MLPQRVQHDSAQPASPAEDALELRAEWVYHGDPYAPSAHEAVTSPARKLHQELAMRLGDLAAPGIPAGNVAVLPGEAKWPMPARVATIVSMSLILWGGIYLALARIITG